MTRRAWIAAAVGAALLHGRRAHAHAFLERADPRVGGTLRVAPARVRLWFTESLESAFSRVEVFASSGERVDRGDVTLDAADRRLMAVSLAPLAAGPYRVVWRALSIDSHLTEGDFTFHLKP